jgi:hypothetical protein
VLEAGSFEEYLPPVAAGISPCLISPSAFSAISSVARVLPSPLAYNTFGFECRLGEELPRADFLVLATAACGRDSLAGLHPTSTLPTSLMADPVWRRVRDFSAYWAEPSSPLFHAVDNIWLEFDIDGPVPDLPIPSVFFGLMTNVQTDATHESSVDKYRATVETAIRLLSGSESQPRMLETLSRCFRALSSDEPVFQVGLMLSRGASAVRLCIRLRSVERIVEYLAEVGWPGDEAGLRNVLDPLARSVDRVLLDIDVGETVGAKIGLECYFDGNRQPGREPRWDALLNSLVLQGLCTADKREALLAYSGYVAQNAPGVPWPGALVRTSQLLGGRSLSTFVRSLHHVKIVYRPGEPLEAKAYLAGNHHWHTPASRASSVRPRERSATTCRPPQSSG